MLLLPIGSYALHPHDVKIAKGTTCIKVRHYCNDNEYSRARRERHDQKPNVVRPSVALPCIGSVRLNPCMSN